MSIKALYVKKVYDTKCGTRRYNYGIATFLAKPESTIPTIGEHDYTKCKGCQNSRQQIIESLNEKMKKFPFCCKTYKKLLTLIEFNKNDYFGADVMCADKTIFCYQHILNNQDKTDWKDEIENYLEYTINSFGSFPEGYGAPLFIGEFLDYLAQLVKGNSDIKPEVQSFVDSYIADLKKPVKFSVKNPISLLLSKYDAWLKSFPFDFPEFQEAKNYFEQRSPIMVMESSYNPYTKLTKAHLIEEKDLVDYLLDCTKTLIRKIDLRSLERNPILLQYQKLIVDKTYQIENEELFESYSNEELRYISLIKKWLKIQQNYIEQTKSVLEFNKNIFSGDTYDTSYLESIHRINFFKNFIEDRDGYKLFNKNGNKCKEIDIQLSFKLVWYRTEFSVDSEVGNGRGFVDFIISKGANDKTLIEFKLVSNSKLEANLVNQLSVYEKASNTNKSIEVILYFSDVEKKKLDRVLKKTGFLNNENVITIDCIESKLSASNIK